MSRRLDIPPAAARIDLLHRSRWQLALAAVWFTLAALHGAAAHATAAAAPLEFRSGNPKMATMLARLNATRELAAEPFSVAVVDLNGDGQNEIIVRSDGRGFCGAGGCLTVVLEQQGPRMVTLLSQNLFPGLGVTNDKVGAYRALAALDSSGVIVTGDKPGTPLFGKPLVYPMQAPAAAETSPGATQAPASATTVAPSTPAGDRRQPDVVGLRLGMSLEDVKGALGAHFSKPRMQERRTMVNDAPSTEYLSVLTASTGRGLPVGPEDAISVDFAPPPAAHRAIYIERFNGFAEGSQPLYTAVRSAVVEKFGPPTHVQEGPIDTYLVWAYDRGGKPITGVNAMRCSKYAPGDPSRRSFTVLFAQIKPAGCGLTVFAKLGYATLRGGPGIQRTELASYLSVSVIDDSGFDALREAAAGLAASERRRKGAAVGGPKL